MLFRSLSIGEDSQQEESKVNYRITLDDLAKINEYNGMLHMRKNHLVFGVLVKLILDKSIDPKDKEFISIMKKTKKY